MSVDTVARQTIYHCVSSHAQTFFYVFRKTVVHRFLIRGTVEERMHAAVQSGAEKWSGDKVTLRQLQDLFASPCEESSNNLDSIANSVSSTTPSENITSAPSTSSRVQQVMSQ
jgi:hypothetical protein